MSTAHYLARMRTAITLAESPPPRRRHGFTTWLRKQCDRDDPVGDVARDYIDDCRIEKTQFSTAELRRRIRIHGCFAAEIAFGDALAEYMRSRRAPS